MRDKEKRRVYMREWWRRLKKEKPEKYQEYRLKRREYAQRPDVKEKLRKARHEHYLRNKDKFREASKRWKRNHPEKRWATKIRNLWGKTHRYDAEAVKESEFYVAREVLPKHNFTDILITREIWSNSFPFDIIAMKDGTQHGIDVTLCWAKKIKPTQREFSRRFKTPIWVCHVKPDYTWYLLMQIPFDKTHNSIATLFIKETLGPQQPFIRPIG